jgi:hypothetical protein
MRAARRVLIVPALLLLSAAVAMTGETAGPEQEVRQRGQVPRPCPPVTGESLSARDILDDLLRGEDVIIERRLIEGSLDMETAGPVEDERVSSLRVIPGRLTLRSCRVAGRIAFPRCVFRQGLEMPCTEIRGDVEMTGAVMMGSFDGSRMRVVGQARLAGMQIGGDLRLDDASLSDRLDLTGLRVAGRLGMTGGRFEGDVDISHVIAGSLGLGQARVAGRAMIRDVLVLSNVDAREAAFGRGLAIELARITGQADLDDAEGAEGFRLSGVSVGEDLLLAVSTSGPLELSNVTIGGDLSLFVGSFGPVSMDGVVVRGESDFDDARFRRGLVIRNSDFGREFSADEARFEGDCVFSNVSFPGDDPMSGAYFARAPVLVDTELTLPDGAGPAGDPPDRPKER